MKAKHLARNPHLSLCYLDLADPSRGLDLVYVDCRASWDDSAASRERIWQLFASTPPPLGYDPATILKATDDPEYVPILKSSLAGRFRCSADQLPRDVVFRQHRKAWHLSGQQKKTESNSRKSLQNNGLRRVYWF